jgi:hypothetical protein
MNAPLPRRRTRDEMLQLLFDWCIDSGTEDDWPRIQSETTIYYEHRVDVADRPTFADETWLRRNLATVGRR